MEFDRIRVIVISSKYIETYPDGTRVPLDLNTGLDKSIDTILSAFMPMAHKARRRQKKSWVDVAADAATRIVDETRSTAGRVLIAGTYSPIDALVAANIVSARSGIKLWADFRDGFTYESLGRKGLLSLAVKELIERAILSRSCIITAVSESICSFYRIKYKETVVSKLPNGFDPEYVDSTPAMKNTIEGQQPYGLGHFGRVELSDGSSFGALEMALRVMAGIGNDVRAEFVGDLSDRERSLIGEYPFCAISDSVPRAKAHEMMRGADALLLITGSRTGTVTGKIFEYLASGRRIVLFSLVHNDAAKLIAEIGDDDFVYVRGEVPVEEASKALLVCLSRPFTRNLDRIAVYDKKRQARMVERIVDQFAQ